MAGLSDADREEMQRLLSHPLEIPTDFKQWFADWFATNIPKLPISQVFGFKLDRLRYDEVPTQQSTSSTSYADLATVGPQLQNLAPGYYLCVFGGGLSVGATTDSVFMSLSLNGSTPADADGCQLVGFSTTNDETVGRALLVHLTKDINNVVCKYRVSAGTHSFVERYLYAFKVQDLNA